MEGARTFLRIRSGCLECYAEQKRPFREAKTLLKLSGVEEIKAFVRKLISGESCIRLSMNTLDW